MLVLLHSLERLTQALLRSVFEISPACVKFRIFHGFVDDLVLEGTFEAAIKGEVADVALIQRG